MFDPCVDMLHAAGDQQCSSGSYIQPSATYCANNCQSRSAMFPATDIFAYIVRLAKFASVAAAYEASNINLL